MKLSKYIAQIGKDSANLLEEIGYTIYPIGDGTYYSVDEDAPQEAHDLAISAIEGYPDAVDEVRGFEVTKSSPPTSKNKTLAGQIRKMKE
jgi:hypothetical protein